MNILELLVLSQKVFPKTQEIVDDVKNSKWSELLRDTGDVLDTVADWLDSNKILTTAVAPQMEGAEAESFSSLFGHGLLGRVVRNRVAERLAVDGFALVGGDSTPLTKERIESLFSAAEVSDDVIMARATEMSLFGDGSILSRLGELLKWLMDHKDQILELVKFIMTLLALFA